MHCPYCKSKDIWRLQPLPWMTHVRPRFKNRRCSNCGHEFAVWMNVFCMKHRTGRKLVLLYFVILAALAVLFAADLYRWKARPSSSWLHLGYDAIRNVCELPTGHPRNTATKQDAPPPGMSPY